MSIFILLGNLVCNILSRQNLSFQLRAKSSDPNIDIKMKFYVIQKAKEVLKTIYNRSEGIFATKIETLLFIRDL